jgi:hypothetical protein
MSVLQWLQAETKVATILGDSSFLVGGTVIQNPRRVCHRVSNFCIDSLKKKTSGPLGAIFRFFKVIFF